MKVILKKDIVIKAGTVFEDTEKSELFKPFVTNLGLSDDCIMFMAVWDEVIKEVPDMFEEVKEAIKCVER